jgi:hypothetical protein
MQRLVVAVTLVVCLAALANAAVAGDQQYTISPTSSPIVVDGRLDDSAWERATVVQLAYEHFPGDNSPAAVQTTCRLTYDARRLYVGCLAADPDPSAIQAALADRDAPQQDDAVAFFVDPFSDGRRAFQFRVNARGVQMDGVLSDVEGGDDWSWDTIWDAKAQLTDAGYAVEMAIPFSSLRFPRTDAPQTWGFLFERVMPRSARIRLRSNALDRNRACAVCQFDRLTGFTGITPGGTLELDPTLTVARTDRRPSALLGTSPTVAGRFAIGERDTNVGLSARWNVTPNVALSGTVNPDFYQVEADAAQLDVNTRFQLRFPEKRPFFLEGADLFRTPFEAVFTRTVADPIAGVKLSGKQGPHAFGAFVAQDDVTGILVPGFDGSAFVAVDRTNVSTVVRYRRDVGGSGSTLGVLATDREAGDYGNRVAGVDGLLRPGAAETIRFQWLASQTDYPTDMASVNGESARSIAGQAVAGTYAHRTRNWNWAASAAGLSPQFRADAGFVPQVDTRTYSGNVGRTFLGRGWFNEINLSAGCDRTTDWANGRTSWGCDNSIDYSGPKQFTLSYNAAPNQTYFAGQTFPNFRHNVDLSIRPTGALSLFLDSSYGHNVDYANARRAGATRYTLGADYNLFARLTGTLEIAEQRLRTEEGARIFVARLTQGRVNYHFTPRAFARIVLQYTDVVRNTAVYVQPTAPATRRLFTQWLFSYRVSPQTVFLAGYSDNADGSRTPDLIRTDRTFFLKVGYAVLR